MNAMLAITPEASEDWTDVGAVSDIPLRGARRLPSPLGDIAVFRTGDSTIFALRDICPHKGGPLSQGIVHGHAVSCPLHNWCIDLKSGMAMGADKDKGSTPVVPVQVHEGRILVGRRVP
jgi:nitrite reductase (NADH) small subunit